MAMRRLGIVIMQYRSTAPPLPGPPPIEVSEGEESSSNSRIYTPLKRRCTDTA